MIKKIIVQKKNVYLYYVKFFKRIYVCKNKYIKNVFNYIHDKDRILGCTFFLMYFYKQNY